MDKCKVMEGKEGREGKGRGGKGRGGGGDTYTLLCVFVTLAYP